MLICAPQSKITGSRFPSEVVALTRISDGLSPSQTTRLALDDPDVAPLDFFDLFQQREALCPAFPRIVHVADSFPRDPLAGVSSEVTFGEPMIFNNLSCLFARSAISSRDMSSKLPATRDVRTNSRVR